MTMVTPAYVTRRGGWRGLLTTRLAAVQYRFGRWRRYGRVEMNDIERVVVICMGNICRSPYAAARLRALGYDAVSAGLDVSVAAPADAQAVVEAARRGIDLADHRSRRFAAGDCRSGDLLLVVEPAHLATLEALTTGAAPRRVGLLGLWCPERVPCLFDPHGRSEAYFCRCFDLIDSACAGLDAALRA